MSKVSHRLLSLVLVLIMVLPLGILSASAASATSWVSMGISASNTIKCYVKGTSNVTTYTTNALSTKSGSVYVSDEMTVKKIAKNANGTWYAYINYPVSGGTKNAYIPLSAISTSTTAGAQMKATTKISNIYRRANTTKYGSSYISKGDTVYKLTTSGNYTQVLYPISGGWKMVWIKTTDANSYLTTSSTTTSTASKAKLLASVALNEVGYHGTKKDGTGTGDYTKYGKWMNQNGVYWCAEFVSWCVNQAGVSTAVVPKTASTLTMAQNSSSYIKWSNSALKNIKQGDVIFFSHTKMSLTTSSGAKSVYHVGVVYGVDTTKGTITIVEGNTSSDYVKKNTYTVTSNTGWFASNSWFCGYISVK